MVDNLKNRSRCCNLKVINVVEKSEGTDVVKFMSNFFANVLGDDMFPTPLVLDWHTDLAKCAPGLTLNQDP